MSSYYTYAHVWGVVIGKVSQNSLARLSAVACHSILYVHVCVCVWERDSRSADTKAQCWHMQLSWLNHTDVLFIVSHWISSIWHIFFFYQICIATVVCIIFPSLLYTPACFSYKYSRICSYCCFKSTSVTHVCSVLRRLIQLIMVLHAKHLRSEMKNYLLKENN